MALEIAAPMPGTGPAKAQGSIGSVTELLRIAPETSVPPE